MKRESKKNAKEVLMFRQVSAMFAIYLMISLTFITANAIATPAVEVPSASGSFGFSAVTVQILNFILPGVSAQASDSCCVKTVAGDYCQSGVAPASCSTGYSSNKCSDLAVPECQIGTCVQQNGDCDASSTKEQCENNNGFWSNQPLLAIPACTPTCCVYKSGAQIVDSQFVFFRNKCEKLPQAKDEKLPFEEQDIGFNACQQIVPAETKGYCTVAANAACTYTTRADCDAKAGDFSSKRCSSCQQNFEQKCFSGDQGYGVYNFDSCSGPGAIVNNCALSEICEDKNNVVQCVDKTCSLDVKFTNLGYDTAYIKSGQVEVLTKNGKVMAGAGSKFSLSQGDQACVNFQGPGEQHYAATCQLGELLVFGMDDNRDKVCTFSGTKATAQTNNYRACTNSGKNRAGLLSNGGILSDVFDFLGGDFINPKWWDYYVVNPGLSDRVACENQGMCVEGPNNDCVPKYAPASVDLCGECSTTEASSPWNKCGDTTQCTSRGYCQLTENKMNPFAGATVCAIQTATQKALIFGIGKLANPSLEKERNDRIDELGGTGDKPEAADDSKVREVEVGVTNGNDKALNDGPNAAAVPNILERGMSHIGGFTKWLLGFDSKKARTADEAEKIASLTDAQNSAISTPFGVINVLDYIVKFFGGTSAIQQYNNDKAVAEQKSKADDQALQDSKNKLDNVFGKGADATTSQAGVKGVITFSCGKNSCFYNPQDGTVTSDGSKLLTSEEKAAIKDFGVKLDAAIKSKKDVNAYNVRDNAQTFEQSKAAEKKKVAESPAQKPQVTDAQLVNIENLENLETFDRSQLKIEHSLYLSPDKKSGVDTIKLGGGTPLYFVHSRGSEDKIFSGGTVVPDKTTVGTVEGGTELREGEKKYIAAKVIYINTPFESAKPAPPLPASPDTNVQTPAPSATSTFLSGISTISKEKTDNSQYYGGLYYFPLRRATESSKASYLDAVGEWWKAQGGFSKYLLSQFKSMGKSLLIGYLFDVVLKNVWGAKYFHRANPQFWIKRGICYSLGGFYAAAGGLTAVQVCEKSDFLIPVLTCSVQTYAQGSYMSNNACVPVGAQGMPGVQTGFQNCEKCQADSFPCTVERCQALSADSSCVYDPYARQCTPDPEKLKSCDTTQNANLRIIEMNNTAVPSNNVIVINDIPYENLQQEIKIRTSLTAECRMTTNKTEGWANMKPLIKDATLKFHNATLDMSDFTRQNFTTFFLCQDACRKQEFSPIAELRLEKRAKPDLVGPVIVSKFPAIDLPIEGGDSGKKDITISVETDEDASCKYKEWPLAEGIDSFVGDISNIEKIASNLLNAGTSEQVLDSELSLTGLRYDDPNMTLVGTLGNFSKKHSVKFSGTSGLTKALSNDKIYAYVFLCKDAKGNLGEVPGVVRFKVSNPFSVTISGPEDTTVETKPVVDASTDKDSSCRYSLENKDLYSNMTSFDSSGGKDHETSINRLLAYGTHRVFVTCLDSDGFNIASADKTFSVTRDTTAARIVRAYKDSDTLLIATNEPTSCQYSFRSFAYGKGSDMTGNDPVEFEHRAEWRPETTYFLSCRDRFGNVYGTSLKTTQEATSAVI